MKLPFLSKKSEKKQESYFALLLQENKVTGFVYELHPTRISILAQHSATYANGMDSIVEDIDDLLFRLETDTNKKLNKTIFFVTSYFLDEETKQIKKEFKPVIKKITHELELEAMGFIECYEAVSTLIAKKEGVHLNLVLVEMDETIGHVFVYKNDKQAYNAVFQRTEKIIDDLTEAFTKMKGSFMLPARIVLYPHSHSHKQLVHLVNHTWSEDLFVQMPKIEVISEDELYTGLAEIFYAQLRDEAPSSASLVSPEQEEMPADNAEEVMGFAIGADISEEFPKHTQQPAYAQEETDHTIQTEQLPPAQSSSTPKPFVLAAFFSRIKGTMSKIKMPLKLPFLIPLAVAGALIVLLLGSELFLHKEVVKIAFPTKNIEKTVTLTSDELTIKTGTISADISDSLTTTGKKDIGEKAKGEVTVRNFDDREKTISKGSTLTVDGKSFILDQDVKVASASVSSDNTSKVAGQAKGSITADTIGPDYNLDKNKKFHIGDLDFSLFFAINEAALSGGSKKQAQTVSQKDIADLKTKVLAAGKKQGLDKMRLEVSKDQQIIDKLTEQELTKVDFSKEVGDEAKVLTVKAKVTTTYHTYSENDVKKLVQKTLQSDVETGFILPVENVKVAIEDAEEKKDVISLTVVATGKSTKQVSKDDIISTVKGIGKNSVEEMLRDKYNAVETTIEDKGISFFPWMPFFKNNITIEISSK